MDEVCLQRGSVENGMRGGQEDADQHAQGGYQGNDLHEAPESEQQAPNHFGDDGSLVECSVRMFPQCMGQMAKLAQPPTAKYMTSI